MLSPDLFTKRAVACYQTGREQKCQVYRLCSTIPMAPFEPATTECAPLWGGMWRMSWVFACVIGGDPPLIVTYAFAMWVCLAAFLGWTGLMRVRKTSSPHGTIRLAPSVAVPERPPLKSELAYFFVQEACVGYLLCARFFQAS